MDEVKKYILEKRAMGVTDEHIISELKSVGWVDEDINKALAEVTPVSIGSNSSPTPRQPFDPSAIFNQGLGSGITQNEPASQQVSIQQIVESTPSDQSAVAAADLGGKPNSAKSKYLKIIAVILVIAVLGFGAYYAYSYFLSNPQKVW